MCQDKFCSSYNPDTNTSIQLMCFWQETFLYLNAGKHRSYFKDALKSGQLGGLAKKHETNGVRNGSRFLQVQVLFLGVRNASKGGLCSSHPVSDSGYDQPERRGIRAVIFLKWVWGGEEKFKTCFVETHVIMSTDRSCIINLEDDQNIPIFLAPLC